MMVGHTHDDIDQMFSRFNVGLRAHPVMIYTLSKFCDVMKHSYTPNPEIEFIYGVRDWKEWLNLGSSQEVSKKNALHGHLRPHQFSFRIEDGGARASMRWKRWARDSIWYPQLSAPLQLMAKDLDIALLLPKRRK